MLGKCKSCYKTSYAELDLRSILFYTEMFDLWLFFQKVIKVSSFTQEGYTMDNLSIVLSQQKRFLTYPKLFSFLGIMLEELNKFYIRRRKDK